jgi:hypothetical protein
VKSGLTTFCNPSSCLFARQSTVPDVLPPTSSRSASFSRRGSSPTQAACFLSIASSLACSDAGILRRNATVCSTIA